MSVVSENSELASEVTPSNSTAELGSASPSPRESKELEKKESGDTIALKRGVYNKSKLSPLSAQTAPPAPARKDEGKGYLKCLFSLNLFAWDIILFKNSVRTILIIGAVVFSIILTFYPLLHCLVLILLLGFAASILYSLLLLLFRIIVGKPATHPFRHWLSQSESQIDPAITESLTKGVLEVVAPLSNSVLRLVLFYDLRNSITACFLLYFISYVTVYITLPYILTLVLFTAFVAPRLYSLSQEAVDRLIGKMLDRYKRVAARIEKVVDTE